jgi:hypothetical protein
MLRRAAPINVRRNRERRMTNKKVLARGAILSAVIMALPAVAMAGPSGYTFRLLVLSR